MAKLLELRAEAARLDREWDAAEAADNIDAMDVIAMRQLACDDAIEAEEERLTYCKRYAPCAAWSWSDRRIAA